MKTNTFKRNLFFAFITICFIAVSVAVLFSAADFRTMSAYAMDSKETVGCEGIEEIDREINESLIEQAAFEEFENIMMLSSGGGRSSNEGIISGTTTSTLLFSDLTNVKYIPNANYFLINPQQGINDGSDNGGGTCTTVAMQMLMGYHNYYSDRRIIPEVAENGTRFLDATYGDLSLHPAFQRTLVGDTWIDGVLTRRGCPSIGTANTVYQDIFDRTWISSWYGIGQAVGLVKDGAVRFINTHTPQAARNGMSLTSGFFSKSTAQADIDAGRPIVLGMESTFSGATSYHVVPAYGYAKLDGVDGFLVHYGWGAGATQVWVPSSWFGFQIRMSTTHAHTFTDTGININNTHRELECSVCGATSVDSLYNLSGETITRVSYPLSESVTIPNSINIYSTANANFTNQAITAIGSSAFANQTQLSQVSIPASVRYINSEAFEYCVSLRKVTFLGTSQLQTIGSSAFSGCTQLPKISIPTSVTSIDESAFSNCKSLTNVTIPNSVTYIGNYAFFGCTELTNINLPNKLSRIGDGTFCGCVKLTNLTIPDNVLEIGVGAFEGCEGLTNITIPSSVGRIGNGAFQNCYYLQVVYVERATASITALGVIVFKNCISLASIYVPDTRFSEYSQAVNWSAYKSMIRIKSNFYSTPGLAFILSIADTYKVSKGTANTNGIVYIPARYNGLMVDGIAPDGFRNCNGLTGVVFEKGIEIRSIGTAAFYNCSALKNIEFPEYEGLTLFDGTAFANCTSLTEIRLPKNVNSLRPFVFEDCSNLRTVYIERPASMGLIGLGADPFFGCDSLESIYLPDEESVIAYRNDKKWSRYEELINTELLFTYTSSGNAATITGVKQGIILSGKVDIPSKIKGLPVTAIGACALQNQILCNEIIIPNSVTSIGDYAFSGCSALTSITMSNSLTSIGDYAFSGCSALKIITMSNSVTSIGSYAFSDCSALTSITIPSSVTSIGDYAFSGYNGLTSIIIPSSVTSIGNFAFSGCSGLTSVAMSNSVTSIGSYAFSGCSALKNITISNSVTSIGIFTFRGCSGLTSITIPNSVISIGNEAFSGCSGLTSIIMSNSVTSIGNFAFNGCSRLTSIIIPSSLTSIDDYAFSGCSGLTSIIIPNSIKSIGNFAFSGCSGLTSVTIPSSVTSIGNGAFSYCSGLTSISIPDSVISIGRSAFLHCSGLTSVKLPEGLKIINESAFRGCSGLKSIVLPFSLNIIGSYAFYYCSGLTSVTMQINLLIIEVSAFEGCSGLTSITLPNEVREVGSYAFNYCSNLTTVYVKNSYSYYYITTLGINTFSNCPSLTSIYVLDETFYKMAPSWSDYQSLIKYMPEIYMPRS